MTRPLAFLGLFAAGLIVVAVLLRAYSGGRFDALGLGAAAIVLVPVVRYFTTRPARH